jgi:hypothetical protein
VELPFDYISSETKGGVGGTCVLRCARLACLSTMLGSSAGPAAALHKHLLACLLSPHLASATACHEPTQPTSPPLLAMTHPTRHRGCVPKKLMVYASEYADDFKDSVGFG